MDGKLYVTYGKVNGFLVKQYDFVVKGARFPRNDLPLDSTEMFVTFDLQNNQICQKLIAQKDSAGPK